MLDPDPTSADEVQSDRSGIDELAPPPAHWGFLATVLWASVIAALSVIMQIAGTIAVADRYSFPLASLLTMIACCGSVVGIVRLKRRAELREYLGLRPVTWRIVARWIGLFAVGAAALTAILAWLDRSIDTDFMSVLYQSTKPVWLLWLTVIVVIPLFEETVFRGFLLAGLAASFMRPIGAVLVTSGLWAAAHVQYDATGIAVIFCFGVLLGAARIRTGSLVVPLTLHALQNLLAIMATAVVG